MAKLYYQPIQANTKLHVYEDPQELVYTELQAERNALLEVQGDSDALRTEMALGGLPGLGIPRAENLQEFDDAVQEELDRVLDILDYENYGVRVENLTVKDGAWFLPEALEDFSSENVGEEAVRAIDGTNNTWWETVDTTPFITVRVRSYKKSFNRIRLRSTSGDLRAQLQNVDVRIANSLGLIDDPGNLVGTFSFTYAGNAWIEVAFPSKKGGRYLKLDGFTSLHADPSQIRVREVGLFAIVSNHNK